MTSKKNATKFDSEADALSAAQQATSDWKGPGFWKKAIARKELKSPTWWPFVCVYCDTAEERKEIESYLNSRGVDGRVTAREEIAGGFSVAGGFRF